jgi:uncharacterized protein
MSSRLIGAILVLLTISLRPCLGAPIHDAARQGDLNAVMTSLDQGVGVDALDATGETPLITAALAGQSQLVAALIKRGAKIGARNDRGLTALHAACYSGDMQSVQLLLQAGASVNDAENKFKVTPLIIAAEGDHPLVINYLIERGAVVEWKERGGYTALSRALFKKHRNAVEALLKSGAVCQPNGVISAWASEDCIKQRAAIPQ